MRVEKMETGGKSFEDLVVQELAELMREREKGKLWHKLESQMNTSRRETEQQHIHLPHQETVVRWICKYQSA